ncbi:recombinase family protein [Leucobacter komagatae]|uniref:Resolvase/invertase-type recombinase catalytic domain-containing protein n=2 Tax=Leucobacter komagatae TaxID=55969 RepID=A0A0D0IPB7_9MICO|nr:recombinase family protein [Leucobacter komagatae]KIP51388.1 hypothetical protein SD72_15645 [Leucobacter komagatae]
MASQVYGYMHLDYSDEHPEQRAEALGSVALFCDYGPRYDTARVNLNRMLAATQTGDFIFVDRIDRIADSVSDFYDLLLFLKERGVGFEALEDAFILKPVTGGDAHADGSPSTQQDSRSPQVPDESLELIGRMAALERAKTMKGPRGFAFDFATMHETDPVLTLERVLGAEQQLAAGVPLSRIATALRVTAVELFKAIRRDNEYASYLKI